MLELTLVITILLSLIGLLVLGANTWKKGSDRALCIMNLQAVQKGVRSFSNLNGYEPGRVVAGLEDQIIGTGRFVEAMPICPAEGAYTTAGDMIPAPGELYLNCSLASEGEHEPLDLEDW